MADRWHRDLWLDALWECDSLKPNERCVAYVYARYSFEGDTAWCSWAEVMRRTGIRSKNGVWLALKSLVDGGWLEQVEKPRQHRSAVYRLTVPVGASDVPHGDSSEVPRGDSWNPEVPVGIPEVPVGTPEVPRLRHQNSKENSQENSHSSSVGAQSAPVHRAPGRTERQGWAHSAPPARHAPLPGSLMEQERAKRNRCPRCNGSLNGLGLCAACRSEELGAA